MRLFFIEMGQGIIGKPEMRVITSALHNCTLIAGYNRASGYGGAYHYPSLCSEDVDVLRNMDIWAATLRPTEVTLVFAQNATGMGDPYNTDPDDRAFLHRWVQQSCDVIPVITSAVAAGARIAVGVLQAGRVSSLPGDFNTGQLSVNGLHAGTYMLNGTERITVIGENLEREGYKTDPPW